MSSQEQMTFYPNFSLYFLFELLPKRGSFPNFSLVHCNIEDFYVWIESNFVKKNCVVFRIVKGRTMKVKVTSTIFFNKILLNFKDAF